MGILRIPPLYALKAFESASRHISFTKAANELSITQSAISKHIHTLEDFFGHRLFTRNGPKVMLTREGEFFAKEIQMIFNSLNAACENFYLESSKFCIKSPTTFSLCWLLEAIGKFNNENGHMTARLDSNGFNHERIDFKENKYECAIQFGNGEFPSNWQITRLLDEWVIPVCAPGFLPRHEDLSNFKFNLLYSKSKDDLWSLWCDRTNNNVLTNVANRYEFNTMNAAISAAIQGLGIAIVDINMIKREIENGTLFFPVKTATRTGNSYFFVYPRRQGHNKNIILLNDYLRTFIVEERIENINYIK